MQAFALSRRYTIRRAGLRCRCLIPNRGSDMGYLSHLRLRSFRNYVSLDLVFSPGFNVLVGANGQGKSNLIEAVCYLALLRSFRSRRIAPLKQWGAAAFFVGGRLCGSDDGAPHIDLSVGYEEKRVLQLNRQTIDKASDFINAFICVTLVPEDIELVVGAAGLRRRFLDIFLCQVDPCYMVNLQRYLEALRCRNLMLRRPEKYPEAAFASYEHLLIEHGAFLVCRRIQWVERLNAALTTLSPDLFQTADLTVSLVFSPSLPRCSDKAESEVEMMACFAEALERSRERDLNEGATRYGPHRDGFIFHLNGRDLSLFGSEGERRAACLALRLACLSIVRASSDDERPVVLLVDDVLGELDPLRRRAFFSALGLADQVFVTCTTVPEELYDVSPVVYRVGNGEIEVDGA